MGYENLADLSEVVDSLRNDLTRTTETGSSFLHSLHSFSHNYSRDDLDAIYQLSNGHVALFAQDQQQQQQQQQQQLYPNGVTAVAAAAIAAAAAAAASVNSSQEPIYQNI